MEFQKEALKSKGRLHLNINLLPVLPDAGQNALTGGFSGF